MISLNWVKDYINLDGEDLKKLAVKITKAGVNVEKVITNHIDNLVIGEVLECEDIPDTHLHLCKVNIGECITQIVCGAPNVRKGIKVIVALPGAILPGDFDRSLLNGDVKKTLPEWAELGVTNPDGTPIPNADMIAGLVADTKEIAKQDLFQQSNIENPTESDVDIAPKPVITAYLTYPNFYRIKKWNNSSWYAIAIAELADKLKI